MISFYSFLISNKKFLISILFAKLASFESCYFLFLTSMYQFQICTYFFISDFRLPISAFHGRTSPGCISPRHARRQECRHPARGWSWINLLNAKNIIFFSGLFLLLQMVRDLQQLFRTAQSFLPAHHQRLELTLIKRGGTFFFIGLLSVTNCCRKKEQGLFFCSL